MQTLRECVAEAVANKRALAHFNFSNLEVLRVIADTARSLRVPVIVGLSEGERAFVGLAQAVALVASFRAEGVSLFLNADHSSSLASAHEAIDAGFDAVIFDGTQLSFAENVKSTRECSAYARASGRDVIVEGELGFIGMGSQIRTHIPEGVNVAPESLTSPEDARTFVRETGVDLLAPAVGNIHGMFQGGTDPRLAVERIAAIREAAGVPLVLHGASGNTADDIRAAVVAGVGVVHWNTELRAAYRKGLVRGLEENPDDLAPYKYLKEGMRAVQKVVEEKIHLLV